MMDYIPISSQNTEDTSRRKGKSSQKSAFSESDQLDTLLYRLHRSGNLKVELILRLAWQAGLSASEIAALQWENVQADTLQLPKRTTQLCKEISDLLSRMKSDDPFVFSLDDHTGHCSRVYISQLARSALDSVGLTQLRLKDLRTAYIQQQLATNSLGEVVQNTGRHYHYLQKRYMPTQIAPKSKSIAQIPMSQLLDRLEQELQRQGDSLGALAVRLSWMGGLTLDEMSTLRWQDVRQDVCVLRTINGERSIPPELMEILCQSKCKEESPYIFHRQGSRILKRTIGNYARDWLMQVGLESLSLNQIRGLYDYNRQMRKAVEFLEEKNSPATLSEIQAQTGWHYTVLQKALQEMEENGIIRKTSANGMYALTGVETSLNPKWDKVWRATSELLRNHGQVTGSEVTQAAGLAPNLVSYYLRQAVEKQLLSRSDDGSYRLPETGQLLERLPDLLQHDESTGALVVRLSYICKLKPEEMSTLGGQNLQPDLYTIQVNGERRLIPPELMKILQASKGTLIFDGAAPEELRECGEEWLRRNGLGELHLPQICGQYQPKASQLQKLVLNLLVRHGQPMKVAALQALSGLSRQQLVEILHTLEDDGKIKRANGKFAPSSFQTKGDSIRDAAKQLLQTQSHITCREVARKAGCQSNQASYYLRQAVEEGRMIQTAKGAFALAKPPAQSNPEERPTADL